MIFFFKGLFLRKCVCTTAHPLLEQGSCQFCLELTYTRLFWGTVNSVLLNFHSVCTYIRVFLICFALCLILGRRTCFQVLFSQYFFFSSLSLYPLFYILLLVGFAHVTPPFKMYSSEACVLNPAAIRCGKRTHSWLICVTVSYVLFMSQILFVIFFFFFFSFHFVYCDFPKTTLWTFWAKTQPYIFFFSFPLLFYSLDHQSFITGT